MTSRAGSIAAGLAVFLSVLLVGGRAAAVGVAETPNNGSYAWPVTGPVIRGFELPNGPYSSGHRGIDIAAPFGSPVHAAEAGTVSFAGWVAGALFASIDHPDGYRSTYSWLSAVSVHKGDAVTRGQVVASSGHGHPEVPSPTHLHFGVRLGSQYLDPMLFLGPGSVVDLIHLAPLEGNAGAGATPPRGPEGGDRAFAVGRSRVCADPRMAGHPCFLSFDAARRVPAPGPGPP
jgi:murein DD-endopeptidase MepM/ murein hydrolase activator NlpD